MTFPLPPSERKRACDGKRARKNGEAGKLFEFYDRNARFTLAVSAEAILFHAFIRTQHFVNGGAKFAAAHAVHDTHLFQSRDQRGIEKRLHVGNGFGYGFADDVDFERGRKAGL